MPGIPRLNPEFATNGIVFLHNPEVPTAHDSNPAAAKLNIWKPRA
jgi:hypothetical protein